MPNIVETLDRIQSIYAPLLGNMMLEHRSFAGIETVIREEDPCAYPTADVPPGYASGYTDEVFEAKASEVMRLLIGPTYEAIRGCHPVADDTQPLSVRARRLNPQKPERVPNDGISITVALSGGLGGVHATRKAISLKHAGCFVLLPATLTITTHSGMSDRQVADMKAAAGHGLREVAEYLEGNRLTFNWSPDHDPHLTAWAKDFPDAGAVRVTDLGHGIFHLQADSGFQASKMLVTHAYAAENPEAVALFDKNGEIVVERIQAAVAAAETGRIPKER